MTNKTNSIIFLLFFWTFIVIFSNYFEKEVITSSSTIDSVLRDSLTDEGVMVVEQSWLDKMLDSVSNLPGVGLFVPLGKILFFSWTTIVPEWLSLLLWCIVGLSVWVVLSFIRSGDS